MVVHRLHYEYIDDVGCIHDFFIGCSKLYAEINNIIVIYSKLPGFSQTHGSFHIELLDFEEMGNSIYELYYDDYDEEDNIEYICGYYSSRQEAEKALEVWKTYEPFCFDDDKLGIDEIRLGKYEWGEGFN